jgi:hypothetical protein
MKKLPKRILGNFPEGIAFIEKLMLGFNILSRTVDIK